MLYGQRNLALRLDGKDNNVRTGMGILNGPWTLEAWIRGDDRTWKEQEVIFGGGEYSELNITDYLPLELRNGRLSNAKTGLTSGAVLDDQWHHVALSSDGAATMLYLDGVLVDRKPVAYSILPGALGIHEKGESVFGGLLDEVRIWRAAVSPQTIRDWMGRPITPAHPDFARLTGYYPFDEDFRDVSINWVGKGDQAYHLRNGRTNYRGTAPLAHTVPNDNPSFIATIKQQQVFNAVVIESEWDSEPGSRDEQILKLRVAVQGREKPLSLTELTLDLSQTSSLRDLSGIQVYYAGQTARSAIRTKLFEKSGALPRRLVLQKPLGNPIFLTPGIHYYLVTAALAPGAKPGNTIRMTVPSFRLSGKKLIPETSPHPITKQIVPGSRNDANVVRVLQWNIWHGGVHLVHEGLHRIVDLIRTSRADIVTMQEAYGSQRRIADSLGFQLHTASSGENLALFSRYPLTPLSSLKKMNSDPAFVTLPDGRRLLVNSSWLRYAYRPEYTWVYPNTGLDPRQWVAEDSTLALADIQYILEKDTRPHLRQSEVPVIIGGDFNSCSHLDWTTAAARLHFGYGPVAFPVSGYLGKEGFRDSFREVNPDEVVRPEGTFAAIYGHLQVCRIDFLYYKGNNLRPIVSKIVKTAAEIDDVWASDHSAVLTTFRLAPAGSN
ncbi:Uncharacterized conserved protein YafD, endonuclease/exonuclease/phosphatase (EEP) superfamily [Siphonobacter aquaeclarae]|uniref:Uncharacterized conserved protein YafD, endonuclease/exonuclease/phosphatase (EEP) superfamily n=2 Tax=Siphonobacter aquaeclarae TaxID=563176 RepID=A0A1G9K4D0_9BACT|nr:Uncharacterized conserved protein YafD, endonuclease/exonuclease/phosphatase (EEP) superfamily [Siphonobacter aquaeclarae]